MTVKFSMVDRLRLVVRLICLAPWQALASCLRSLYSAWARGVPPRLFVVCAVIRVFLGTFQPRQIQYMSSSTIGTYKAWIRRTITKAKKDHRFEVAERLRYDVEPLEDGDSSLMWIGNRHKATKVVLFFHGGGYLAPLLPGHLEWCWRAYISAGIEANTEVAVAVLQYTLCPQARYPVQLRQAVSSLEYLLASGFNSHDIVVGGDSAGGNLTAQLLCHLIHPHPTVRAIHLSKPLAGSFLVSPWLSRHTSNISFSKNRSIDILSGLIVDKSTRELLGYVNSPEDQLKRAKLAFPLDTESSCLGGLSAITSQLYATTGGLEVLRDQAVAFVHTVRHLDPNLKLRFEIQERKTHDFILLEGQEERSGECIEAMKLWMMELLSTSYSYKNGTDLHVAEAGEKYSTSLALN